MALVRSSEIGAQQQQQQQQQQHLYPQPANGVQPAAHPTSSQRVSIQINSYQQINQINGHQQVTNQTNSDHLNPINGRQNGSSQIKQSVQSNGRHQADPMSGLYQPINVSNQINWNHQHNPPINGAPQPDPINKLYQSNCYEIRTWPNEPPPYSHPNHHSYDHSPNNEQPIFTNLDSTNLQQSKALRQPNIDHNGNMVSESNRNNCGQPDFGPNYSSNCNANYSTNPIHNYDNYADQPTTGWSHPQTSDQSHNLNYCDQVTGGQCSPYQQANQRTNQQSFLEQSYQQPFQQPYQQPIYLQQPNNQQKSFSQSYQPSCQPPNHLPNHLPNQPPTYQSNSNKPTKRSINKQAFPNLPAASQPAASQPATPQPLSITSSQSNQNSQNNPNNQINQNSSEFLERLRQNMPEFIALLNDSDVRIVIKVLNIVKMHLFDYRDEARMAVATESHELIRTLVSLVVRRDNADVLKLVSHIFYNAAKTLFGLQAILASGYLHVALTKLLGAEPNAFQWTAALSVVHSLVKKFNDARIEVRATGIPTLFRLLDHSVDITFQAVVIETLRLVTIKSQEAANRIYECGGASRLIRILGREENEKLLILTLRLFRMLSNYPSIKPHILQLGGLQIVTKHLATKQVQVALNALWIIQALSDQAANQRNLNNLLKALVELLATTGGPEIEYSVICCIANLTHNSKLNKQLLFEFHGLESMVKLLLRCGKNEKLVVPTLNAIRHMTREHPSWEKCQQKVREADGAIKAIVRYMSSTVDPKTGQSFKWSTNRAAVQLIRSLGRDPVNADQIGEHRALELLFDLLKLTNAESRRNGSQCVKDGVNVQLLLFDVLFTFNELSKNEENCRQLINLNFIPLCIEMIDYQTHDVINLIVAVLSKLATHKLGAEKLSLGESNIVVFNNLLNTTENEETSANVSSILFRIDEHKRNGGIDYWLGTP